MKHRHPPEGWPQRVRAGLPFPPGRDGEEFEIYLDREPGMEWDRYEINLTTLEVYRRVGDRWDAPGWLALPVRVRARIHVLSEGR